MNTNKKTYSFFQNCSAIFMILTLFWLTISTAFVTVPGTVAKKDKIEKNQSQSADTNEEESSPNNSTTEEKAPSGSSFSEEYLHHHEIQEQHYFTIISTYHKCENADTYIAFHGELLVPPPNRA
ncbi:hypothetical protein [Ferruginibacter sp. SUN106]|uniref:hypothetical protein n=1 Tax=Ferruginibacter sp. SUN106 TaxID=2978348 RepID=UPI003D363E2D